MIGSIKKGTHIRMYLPDKKTALFTVGDFIGRGGEGEVYKATARANGVDTTFCVKYLSGAFIRNPKLMQEKLMILARCARALPPELMSILAVSDVFPGGGILYAMHYLDGYENLAKIIIHPDKYTVEMKTKILLGVARAFDALAKSKYHFGDISETNILYKFEGFEPKIRIIDVEGIMPDNPNFVPTVEGTGLYRAPEVIRGGSPNIQSDIHAFSVLAFRMFMGRHPLDTSECRRQAAFGQMEFKRFYADFPRFIFDPDLPDIGVPPTVKRRWGALSGGLRRFFLRNFSQAALHRSEDRFDYKRFIELASR